MRAATIATSVATAAVRSPSNCFGLTFSQANKQFERLSMAAAIEPKIDSSAYADVESYCQGSGSRGRFLGALRVVSDGKEQDSPDSIQKCIKGFILLLGSGKFRDAALLCVSVKEAALSSPSTFLAISTGVNVAADLLLPVIHSIKSSSLGSSPSDYASISMMVSLVHALSAPQGVAGKVEEHDDAWRKASGGLLDALMTNLKALYQPASPD